MIRMFDYNARGEIDPFSTPEPDADPTVEQAVDTLARRAIAARLDAGERRDWWDAIGDAFQMRIDERVGELAAEIDAANRQVDAALQLLKEINR